MKGWRIKLSAEGPLKMSLEDSTLDRAKLREEPLCCFWMDDDALGASHRLKIMAKIAIEFGLGKEKPSFLLK